MSEPSLGFLEVWQRNENNQGNKTPEYNIEHSTTLHGITTEELGSGDSINESILSNDDSSFPQQQEQQQGGEKISILKICKHKTLKIGRNTKEVDFLLNDPSVSSIHCIIWAILFDEKSIPMCYIKDLSLNGTFVNSKRLERNVAYLLNDNDIIELSSTFNTLSTSMINLFQEEGNPHSYFKFKSLNLEDKCFLKNVERTIFDALNIKKIINKNWEISPKIIGNGTFGNVLVAFKKNLNDNINSKPTGKIIYSPRNYAVKIVKLKKNNVDKEAKILLKLNHPNIIKIHYTFSDIINDNLYLFQDLIPGGDLFSYLAKGDCLTSITETESLILVYQILKALSYLHNQGIVHRDLKLDNILLCSPEPCTRIVLADFGIAKDISKLKRNSRMNTIVGTPEYCAPEVGFKTRHPHPNSKSHHELLSSSRSFLNQTCSRANTIEQYKNGYTYKCDLWSLGVVTHIMLTGISPFYGDGTENSIIQNVRNGKLDFSIKHWDHIHENAKDFVRNLLKIDANERFDSFQSLNHSWISNHSGYLEKIYQKKILSVLPLQTLKNMSLNEPLPSSNDWKRKLPKSVNIEARDPEMQ
ncbi:serine/threonine protein kinase MEK1 NDAI_0E03760 [Naumovozyma dairenensis CBS 421]|uniref:Meiosis-specific serine/threonine-protein kinase MEK1 n=1 Tax=Naumovozyma dairenensis (strain ATCC 10597 / BCRC 20456 / CBS 421 / NBRC 0211 / NRRL Y-12639) TaxID=1071378 RepID=G0WBS3_NAUDC|nr:hypothetical protein NDAI_0E03760 [Naumovozyma dairenensis CBS 421]CCD25193.1 hypothetical protein NDAI_0E03760 [Naumovozyma dairenensis CBS 421]